MQAHIAEGQGDRMRGGHFGRIVNEEDVEELSSKVGGGVVGDGDGPESTRVPVGEDAVGRGRGRYRVGGVAVGRRCP